MSNHFAISAVTLTLRDLLMSGVTTTVSDPPDDLHIINNFTVATAPPHRVRELIPNDNVANLFLYRTEINASLRNAPPQNARPGETGPSSLALNLDYLISIYPEDDKEIIGHFFLAQVMRVLHDEPILTREHIRHSLARADLHRQVEHVSVTPQLLSIEEMSKLWSVFSSPYRLTATYQVRVVLIDSLIAGRAPLPVLRRGSDDRGAVSSASGIPIVFDAKPATKLPAVQLGEALVVSGQNFTSNMTVLLHHLLLEHPITRMPTNVTSAELTVQLPAPGEAGVPANWPPGFWRLSLSVPDPGPRPWLTNEVPFALAPAITITSPPPAAETFELSLDAVPQVRPQQDVLLLFGAQQIAPKTRPAPADASSPSQFTFDVTAPAETYRVRLRVDGVDSIPFVRNAAGALEFAASQTVVVP